MARARVSTHTRKQNGKTVTVHQHARSYRAGMKGARYRPAVKKKRAFIDARRGGRALIAAAHLAKKRKRALAIGFAIWGTAEIGAFVALRGTGLILGGIAALTALGASAALSRTIKDNTPASPPMKKAVQKKAGATRSTAAGSARSARPATRRRP